MKKIILIVLSVLQLTAFGQKINKYIKEENVSRVLKQLSSDEMMGRPSDNPAVMEKATAFIESEFKSIGLKPLEGLNSFRQEFTKQMIGIAEKNVMINKKLLPRESSIIMASDPILDYSNLPVAYVQGNESAFAAFGKHMLVESPEIIIVPTALADQFKQAYAYYSGKQLYHPEKKSPAKIFILSDDSVKSHSIKARMEISIMRYTNVVGRLEGKSKKDESIVFSGHYDHLGILESVAGDSIANGADDDASGTTAVIELARYYKKLKKNERTLIFVAFTAEEVGGYGSKYFSEQLNPDKIVAMFNIEMIGKPSKWGQNSAFVTGFERSDFGTILQNNLKGTAFSFNPDPYPEQHLFYRSDNATLARLGVPAHTISTDQIDTDQLYHSVDDEFESLNIANVTATIRAIALSATSIVKGKDTPKRLDKKSVH